MRKLPDLHLWIGDRGDFKDPAEISRRAIDAVIDLALEEPIPELGHSTTYCRFPLMDGPSNPPAIIRAAIITTAELIRSRTPTLVVCSAGMSRSPAITAAALATVRASSLKDEFAFVIKGAPADVSGGLLASIQRALPVPFERF